MKDSQKVAIFCLAHYDDEMGVFQSISEHVARGDRVILLYLTSSNLDGSPATERLATSVRVLKKLGVYDNEDIISIGSDLSVPDLKLHHHFERVCERMQAVFENISHIDYVYALAYEGGHPDHDSTYLLASFLTQKLRLGAEIFQFPMYSGRNTRGPFFSLFKPLPENGSVTLVPIQFKDRFTYLMLFTSYFIVQPKTIVGLFVPFFINFLFVGSQILQHTRYKRIRERPHRTSLLYERRKMAEYEEFRRYADEFLRKHE